jgi:hypothetical protein
MKICSKCGEQKPLKEFSKDKRVKSGLKSWCKSCINLGARKWKQNNSKKVKNLHLLSRYGITLEIKNKMISEQHGRCAICKGSLDNGLHTHTDHCHNSGKIRGILCNHCNRGLGEFKDNKQTLQNAIQYLTTHQQ